MPKKRVVGFGREVSPQPSGGFRWAVGPTEWYWSPANMGALCKVTAAGLSRPVVYLPGLKEAGLFAEGYEACRIDREPALLPGMDEGADGPRT